MFELLGSIEIPAGSPTLKDNSRSKKGSQADPPVVLFHIPPLPVPIQISLGFEGLIAIQDTSPAKLKFVPSSVIGLGPMGYHTRPLIVKITQPHYLLSVVNESLESLDLKVFWISKISVGVLMIDPGN